MELQTILGADKGRNAFYKARDNFTAIQNFINQLKAADIKFDNTDTELTAEDVQAAINELNDNFIELYNNIADIFPFRGTIPANATIDSLKQGTYLEYGTKWNNRPLDASNTNYAIVTVTDTRGGTETYKHIKYLNSDSELFERFGNASWFKVATDKQPNWITATLQNGWTGTLQYRVNQIGQLEISGVIVAGTVAWGTTITQLPVGYRPKTWSSILTFITDGNGVMGFSISTDGAIKIYNPASTTVAVGKQITFSTILPM